MSNSLQIIAVLRKNLAISQEDAQELLPHLENAVSKKEAIDLSFEGVENCTTIFLNNSLGKLYLTFGPEVDEYIRFVGIDKDDLVLPNRLERLRRRALNADVYKPIFESAFGQA